MEKVRLSRDAESVRIVPRRSHADVCDRRADSTIQRQARNRQRVVDEPGSCRDRRGDGIRFRLAELLNRADADFVLWHNGRFVDVLCSA